MDDGDWVSSAAGLRGPRYLVAQAEWQLEGYRAAAEEGLPLVDQEEPLITTLLLAGLARDLRTRLRGRLPALAELRRSLSQMMGDQ